MVVFAYAAFQPRHHIRSFGQTERCLPGSTLTDCEADVRPSVLDVPGWVPTLDFMSHPTTSNRATDPFANPGAGSNKPPDLPDLPPVEAPSAGFVVQLFVIPAAVVVVVVIV